MSATRPSSEPLSAAIGDQLERRLQRAGDDASRLLGLAPEATRTSDFDRLRSLIAGLAERLAAVGAEDPSAAVTEHEAALARMRQRFEGRVQAIARVQAVIGELREVTAPAAMLARAPAALCAGSTLRRAILSTVAGGRMVAEVAYFAQDPAAAQGVLERLRAHPVALEHPLLETELLRRRRATIVLDAHVHPRADRTMAQVMGWRAYVAAPLLVGSQVVGVIHADRGRDQSLDVLDRDVLWEFASGLAHAYESASLRRTLRRERDQMRVFLDWLGARSSELTDAPVTLGTGQQVPRAPWEAGETQGLVPSARQDRTALEGLLTRRELDVLVLLADGATNNAIAGALVISSGTVKFHVNSILRKLHVANRAEAVARYLHLLGMRGP
jgi:DNA-binding CsgD family transcriptional regulator